MTTISFSSAGCIDIGFSDDLLLPHYFCACAKANTKYVNTSLTRYVRNVYQLLHRRGTRKMGGRVCWKHIYQFHAAIIKVLILSTGSRVTHIKRIQRIIAEAEKIKRKTSNNKKIHDEHNLLREISCFVLAVSCKQQWQHVVIHMSIGGL